MYTSVHISGILSLNSGLHGRENRRRARICLRAKHPVGELSHASFTTEFQQAGARSNFETESNFRTARNGLKSLEIRAAGCAKPGENCVSVNYETATPVFRAAVSKMADAGRGPRDSGNGVCFNRNPM